MNEHALTVKAVRDGPVCALILTGDLDLTVTSGFLAQAALAVDDRAERLVLDLAGVTFLDCAGVRALAVAASFAPGGCPVIIRSLSPRARRIFELLDLDLQTLQPAPPEPRATTQTWARRPASRNPAAHGYATLGGAGSGDGAWIIPAQSGDFAGEIAELKGVLLGTDSVDDFLLDLAVLAARELGGDLSCGIILQPRDRPPTVASSDVTAAQVDEVQYRLYSGPGLHSIRTGEHVRIDDLVFEQRWWEYAVRALARGVRSLLSIPVSAQGDPVGSINLYSGRPGFFDDAQTQRAEQFAAEATDAIGHAAQLERWPQTFTESVMRL